MSRNFVFVYNDMAIGGIQTNLYNMVASMVDQGIKVTWLVPGRPEIDESFADYINGRTINIVFTKRRSVSQIVKAIGMAPDDETVIVSFSPLQYLLCEKIKQGCHGKNVSVLYHAAFRWTDYYLERHFRIFRPVVRRWMTEVMQSLYDNGSIVFFADKHYQTLAANYNIRIDPRDAVLAKAVIPTSAVSVEKLREKAHRDPLKIVAVTRFDFPHKGFVIGLIRSFHSIRELYPSAELFIVGYGDGQRQVDAEMSRLPESVRSGIHLLGKRSKREIMEIYREAHVSIGVAGALWDAASAGVISLPARHYSYECEVYGYLQDNPALSVSDAPGKPLLGHIREIAEASTDDFVTLSLESHRAFRRFFGDPDPLWIFDVRQNTGKYLSRKSVWRLSLIQYPVALKVFFRRVLLLFTDPKLWIRKVRKRLRLIFPARVDTQSP